MEKFNKDLDEDEEFDIAELEFPSEEDEGEIDKNIEDIMSNSSSGNNNPPFGSAPSWGSFGNSGSSQPVNNPFSNNNNVGTGSYQSPPWQKPQPSSPTPFFGSSGWQINNNQQQQGPQFQGPAEPATIKSQKEIVIINLFDGLIESRSSEGRPNIIPRAIYDINLRFDVWNAVKSFTPYCVYILVSTIIPDNNIGWNITLKYITSCLSEYLNIPESSCIVVKQMTQGLPKIVLLKNILESGNFLVDKDCCIYIGLNSGYWGLSNEDVLAARNLGIDYVDIFQLINNNVIRV